MIINCRQCKLDRFAGLDGLCDICTGEWNNDRTE